MSKRVLAKRFQGSSHSNLLSTKGELYLALDGSSLRGTKLGSLSVIGKRHVMV